MRPEQDRTSRESIVRYESGAFRGPAPILETDDRCDAPPGSNLPRSRARRRGIKARSLRRAEPAAGRGRHARRRTAPHHRRRRHRQDADAHLPRRPPHRHAASSPSGSSSSPSRAAPRRRCSRAPSGSSAAAAARCTAGRSTRPGTACSAASDPPPGCRVDFTIMDQGDAEDLMQLSRAAARVRRAKAKRFPKKETLHYVYSRHMNTEHPRRRHPRATTTRSSCEYLERLRRSLRRLHRAEAGAQPRRLRRPAALLGDDARERRPSSADRIAALYDHMLVDEYQDTNVLQARILRGMCTRAHATSPSSATTRRASTRSAARTSATSSTSRRQFAGATVVTLEQNYRSTQPILDSDEHAHLARRGAVHQEPLDRARRRRAAVARRAQRRAAADALRRRPHPRAARGGDAARARSPCSSAPATCRPTSRSSSRSATSRSRNGAGSSSSRRRT